MINNHCLEVKWGVSRGRDTYGYNICTVYDCGARKRFSCNGGGYDMLGTSFGMWLAANFQDRLKALDIANDEEIGKTKGNQHRKYYGAHLYEGRVTLDGACGLRSMETIAKAIGLRVESHCNRKGSTILFTVYDEAEVMVA